MTTTRRIIEQFGLLRCWLLACLSVALAVWASPVAAIPQCGHDTVVVYGPTKFNGSTPKQWNATPTTFSTTTNWGRRYVVEVLNGDGTNNRVYGLTLSVNGQEFIGSDECGLNVQSLTRIVNNVPDGNQTDSLTIRVKGASTSYVWIKISHVSDPTFRVFGPYTFQAGVNLPTDQRLGFINSYNATTPYCLHIINGGPTGADRVYDGSLLVNSGQVLYPSDFGTGIATITRPVTLIGPEVFVPPYYWALDVPDSVRSIINSGNAYFTAEIRGTDETPPNLAVTNPIEGLITQSSSVAVTGGFDDQTPVTLTFSANNNVSSELHASPGLFSQNVSMASDGNYTITVHAENSACLSTDVVRHVTRDHLPPGLAVSSPTAGATTVDSLITIAGSWADTTYTTVTVDGEIVGTGKYGSFTRPNYFLNSGPNRITCKAVDAAGHDTSITRFVFRNTAGESAPPTATVSAPPLTQANVTSFLDQVSFLYQGYQGQTQQTSVIADSIKLDLAGVARGRVTARDFGALGNAKVSVLGHPEFGEANTRADGRYDLVLNAGTWTLRFTKAGYLESQRAVRVPAGGYAVQDNVALIGRGKANVVSFDALRIVRGRFASDADGDRDLRVLFQAGTVAKIAKSLAPPDSVSLGTVHLRLNEYTVGPEGLRAMPALLPPASAYTYCVDFTVDEADSIGRINYPAMPAPDVLFTKDVILYVQNFLNFPVGTAVPNGYYERRSGRWVAVDDGWVVKILSDSAGTVTIDSNGDGMPDSTSRRDSLRVTAAELQQLSIEYDKGDVIWRMTTNRFSNADFNPNLSLSANFGAPGIVPTTDKLTKDPCEHEGSIIGCEDRTLGESIPVPGTPYSLGYRSFRASGDSVMRTVRVPVVGTSIPNFLQRIIVELEVAGQRIVQIVPGPITLNTPPVSITWNGLDAYGRRVNGAVSARLGVGYDFSVSLSGGKGMKTLGSSSQTGPVIGTVVRGDRNVGWVAWNRQTISLGVPSAGSDGLGGWTLSAHHFYDNTGEGTVYLGDGSIIRGRSQVARPYSPWNFSCQFTDASTIDNLVVHPTALVYGPKDELYVADDCRKAIFKVDRYGNVKRIAGQSHAGAYIGVDGQLATSTPLPLWINALAVGPDGTLYFASSDRSNPQTSIVCAVTPDGNIHKVIGGKAGETRGGGDGMPISQAWTGYVSGLAVGPDGSVFISDVGGGEYGARIRRIGTNGIITTHGGSGAYHWNDSTGTATNICITDPTDLEVGEDGSVYIVEWSGPNPYGTCYHSQIRRIGPEGTLQMVLPQSSIIDADDIAFASDGSIYLDRWSCSVGASLKRRWPDGKITDVTSYAYDNVSGSQLPAGGLPVGMVNYLGAPLACNSTGGVVCTAGGLVRIDPPITVVDGEIRVPSRDGSQIFAFSASGSVIGRHLYTRDALTGAVRQQFGYNEAGQLTTIRDVSGLTTTIQRNGSGIPLAIVGPFGHRTRISLDNYGYLSAVVDTAGNSTEMTTRADGLLSAFEDPIGNIHSFEYASDGRLSQDRAPVGTGTEANLSNPTYDGNKRTVTLTTGEGRATNFTVATLWNAASQRTVTDPGNLRTFQSDSIDWKIRTTWPDGSTRSDSLKADPRFGLDAPLLGLSRTKLENSLTQTIEVSRTVTGGFNPPTSHGTWREDVIVNSRAPDRLEFHSDSLVLRHASAVGRVAKVLVDTAGRPLTLSMPGLEDVVVTYNPQGQVASVRQGGRGLRFGYDGLGRRQVVRDTLGRMIQAHYDIADRLTKLTLPGGRATDFTWDGAENLLTVSPPARPIHSLDYDPRNLVKRYHLPGAGLSDTLTEYTYNEDEELTRMQRPGGSVITARYDASIPRLDSVTTARGRTSITYRATGQVNTISSSDGITLTYKYNGPIDTSEVWSGAIAGTVTATFDRDFGVAFQRVSGDSVGYVYDNDGFMIRAGALGIARRSDNGLESGRTLGNLVTIDSHTSVGELWRRTLKYGANTIYEATYDRDSLGRISAISEWIDGVTSTKEYTYGSPDTGFVATVSTNGNVTERYAYDGNGNRLRFSGLGGTKTASHDNQDRLLSYGSTTYAYLPSGELASATTNQATTTYSYDGLGNLMKVKFPTGDSLEYMIDGRNRRVGRKFNGVVTHRWLYHGVVGPIAEVDASGAILARYVYGTQSHVPAYMVKNGVTYEFITDHLGSVRLVVNTTGGIAQQLDYDAYGRVISDSNPGFQCFGYAGGLQDSATGLVRFGRRDYDPGVGRWTAKDPIMFQGRDANLYAYVGNDPVNRIDPTGELADWEYDLAGWLEGSGVGDFAAGMGDNLSGVPFTNFNLAHWARGRFHANDVVNPCSDAYGLGQWAGLAVGLMDLHPRWGGRFGKSGRGNPGGLFNNNPFMRVGWGGHDGRLVFRGVIGSERTFGWSSHFFTSPPFPRWWPGSR